MKAQPNSSQPKTTPYLPLDFRAALSTINEEERTVDVIWSTGADVLRSDWWSGNKYIERLSVKKTAVRLDRLNSGAPVLDTHSSYDLASVLGTVVPGSAKVDGSQGVAKLRFAKNDAAVDAVWNKITQGILPNVSVGYRTYAVEETQGSDKSLPIRTATDWEPYEISIVPMGADAGAKLRDTNSKETNACVITRGTEEERMDPAQSETIVERNPADPGAPLAPAAAPAARTAEPTEADLAVERERRRSQGILKGCRAARLPQTFADDLIARGVSLEDSQTRILEELAKRGGEERGPSPMPSGAVVGDDPFVHVRSGIENALLHRVAAARFELSDNGRRYRGMSLLDIARVYLQGRGLRVTDLDRSAIAGMALGLEVRAGMHTTSDFPLLLADVFNKTLRREYDEAPATYKAFTRMTTAPDFKTINRMQLGDAPALLEIKAHGAYKAGTISEGKEAYALKTWGRKFAITRKALINDDTDAFSRMPAMFGRAARSLESDLVWEQITSNPTMGDSVALFHADHGNYDSAGAGLSVVALSAGRAAMRLQTGLDGQKLNLTPRYLLVPTSLETEADQLVMAIQANSTTSVNPFSGKLIPIAEPRLDEESAAAWYLAASIDQLDIVELCMLEGQSGPRTESRIGFDVDGLEIKCGHDVAAKVIDYRGLYKNVGET